MPTTDLDQLMDRASLMLVKMQYVEAQKLCEQALRIAYDCKQWSYFARIILPLQECSRQLRMIAAEGSIVLGTDQLSDDVIATLNELQSGCVVFTGPDAATQALKLIHQVQQQSHHLLILSAITGENHWTVHSAHHPILTVSFPAPPKAWQNQILTPACWEKISPCNWPTPGDWVLDVLEKLGDQMLKTITAPVGELKRIDELRKALHAVTDHEILHQQLAQAATALVH